MTSNAITPPTHATGPKLTIGDLDKTLTVAQVLALVDDVAAAVRDNVEANIEHWSDDDGLHWTPFQNDLDQEVPATANSSMLSYLLSNGII